MQKTFLLKCHQFYSAKITSRESHKTRKSPLQHLTQPNTSQKQKVERFSIFQKIYPVSRIVPKTLTSDGVSNVRSVANYQKNGRGILWTLQKIFGKNLANVAKQSLELSKRYIRTLKTLYANFYNVICKL